jgi:hypothetical protein
MRRYNHYVGPHAERFAGRARNRVARIHIGDAESFDVLRPSGKNILHKLEKDFVETSRVVKLGAGWWAGQASPFITTLAENPPLIALAGRMIHDSRAIGYELWRGPQGVRNFLGVRCWQVFSRALSTGCERGEKAKYG